MAGKKLASAIRGRSTLRIALIGSRGIPASYGGFETFYEQLGVRLAARGHDVTVYNRRHHISSHPKEYEGVRIVTLPSLRTKHLDTFSHTFVSLLHALWHGYDIYYVCIVGNSPLLALIRLFGRKSLLNVDGSDYTRAKWGRLASGYLWLCERIAGRLADVIVADARVTQQRYRDFGTDSMFISYGANLQPRGEGTQATDVLQRLGLETDGYILFVSRLTPENAAHVLVEAFLRTRTTLRLVIVGDAPYVQKYKTWLKGLCDDRIVMPGYQFGENYRQLSMNCRYFVLPSGIDGTRPVLLDQMGFGNCVVVKDAPANVEVVGDAGVLFEKENEVESLRSTIERLDQDFETIERCRAAGLERVRKYYSWDTITDQYETLFRQMASERAEET